MSLSTVSATIQDPSGQVFANGTWQLIFKSTYRTPGLFTDGGVSFNTLYGGLLDATGSFSQVVNRNDTIAPANSHWTLVVSPNASGQSYSVDLNVNSAAFNASAAINAVITNILVPSTPIAHAYKDSEVILTPNSGSQYYDNVNKVLKLWDTSLGAWQSLIPTGGSPTFNNITITGQALVKNFENVRYADQFPGTDYGIKIAAAIADLVAAGISGVVDATAFTGTVATATNPFAGTLPQGLIVLFGNAVYQSSVQWLISQDVGLRIIGAGVLQTTLQYTGGATDAFIKISTATPSVTFIQQVYLGNMLVRGSANVIDTILIKGVHRSQFENLDLKDATQSCFHSTFAITCTFKNLSCSNASGAFVSIPSYGFMFDDIGGTLQTTDGTVTDIRAEGIQTGIYLKSASSMTFNSGTSENNTAAVGGIQIDVKSANNTFIGMDCEANSGGTDILDNGQSSQFINIIAISTIGVNMGPTSVRSQVIGGNVPTIVKNAAATHPGGLNTADQWIGTSSGGTNIAGFEAISAAPGYSWENTGGSLDSKWWDQTVGGNTMLFRILSDNLGTAINWMTVTRSGIALANVDFSASSLVTLPATMFNTTANKLGQSDIVTDSGAINTVETIIVKTSALAANRLIVGTHVRATIVGTCTASAANASTFTVRMGPNGTTLDAAIATAVLAASAASGTNIPFKVVLDFTVRTIGAGATGFVSLELQNQGTTGISPTVQQIMLPSMSAFDTTAAGNIISFSYKTAAATTTSIFKQAVIEFVYN